MGTSHDRLLQEIRALAVELDEQKRQEWHRSLPLAELVGDRWERASRLGFGARASIYDSSVVLGNVLVGPDSWIGPFTILDGSGGVLSIGSWCTVSAGTHVYTHDTVLHSLSGGVIPPRTAAVEIGDHAYVGPNCVITAGVTVGEMAVVAANSLVRCDVRARTVVGGSPAVAIGRVEGDGEGVRLVMGTDAGTR